MTEITGELIKSAVAKKILQAIPEAAGRVYKEGQQQNISGDAFYITQRRVNQENQIKTVLRREYEITVRYEPDINSQNTLEKCAQMGNILMFALKSIDLDNVLVHGIDMNCETVDNNILILVTYPIRIKEEPDTMNPMQGIEIIKEVFK